MIMTEKLQDIIWDYANNQEKLALAKERIIPTCGAEELINLYEEYEWLNEKLLASRLENYKGSEKNE